MEPQLPKPQFSPEAASLPQSLARGSEAFTAPSTIPEKTGPLVEQGGETKEIINDSPTGDPVGSVIFTPPPLPTAVDPLTANSSTQTSDDNMPVSASDDDLIEKEWVEKAKRVVSETRNDPYAQDDAIGRLQADYLKKRYGKEIALPGEK